MNQFSKRRLFASACFALAMTGTSAVAADGAAADGTGEVGEVVVTGSRIKRTDITGVGPATVVTEEAIARTGVANVETILQRLPASATRSPRPAPCATSPFRRPTAPTPPARTLSSSSADWLSRAPASSSRTPTPGGWWAACAARSPATGRGKWPATGARPPASTAPPTSPTCSASARRWRPAFPAPPRPRPAATTWAPAT